MTPEQNNNTNQNIQDIEEKILAIFLNDQKEYACHGTEITAEDFSTLNNQKIFLAITKIVSSGSTIDIDNVNEVISKDAKLSFANSKHILMNINAKYSFTLNIENLINIVTNESMIRKLRKLGQKLTEAKFSQIDASQNISMIRNELNDIVNVLTKHIPTYDIGRVVKEINDIEEKIASGSPYFSSIKTGFQQIDDCINITPQTFNVLCGRPGSGKTDFVINLALNSAIKFSQTPSTTGKKPCVLFFSLEMRKEDITSRMISCFSKHEYSLTNYNINKLKNDKNQKVIIDEAKKHIEQLPIIFEEMKINVETMESIIFQCNINYDVRLVIIDYIGLIDASTNKKNFNNPRHEEVAKIVRDLKMMAKKTNCAIFALAQASRGMDNLTKNTISSTSSFKTNVKNTDPTLSDIKESSQIEAEADAVCFLYQAEKSNNSSFEDYKNHIGHIVTFDIKKNRSGISNKKIKLFYEPWIHVMSDNLTQSNIIKTNDEK